MVWSPVGASLGIARLSARSKQGQSLVEIKHQIKVLYGSSGSTFDEIVFAANHDRTVPHQTRRDVAVVGMDRILRSWKLVNNANERFV
jgi:hypothetical protein